jgi:hypothetical protein
MRILGFSLSTLIIFFAIFWLGTKFPNSLSRVPVIGSL